MRLAVDYTAGVRQHGGVGRYTRALVGALVECAATHTLTLLWAGPAIIPPPTGWPNARVRRLPLPERWMTVAWHRLRLPLPADTLAGGADVFYSPDFALPPLTRARAAVTIHDLSFLTHPETHFPPLRRYLNAVVPRSVARADLVIADSQQTRRDLVRLMNVDARKIEVVLSAADPSFARVPPKVIVDALRRYGITQPYVVSVGTIQPRKNLPVIFDALRRLDGDDADISLVHVGRPGWLYEPIFEALDRSGVKQRVTILAVPDADLVALYCGALALVFPSLYEGFGLPCLEAMACGTPVIASHAGSLAEVVGDAGIVVDPHDSGAIAEAIRRLRRDESLSAGLAQRGRDRAAQFSWEASGRRLATLLERLA